MRVLQICHKPPVPSTDGGCLAMNAITCGLLENGAKVKLVTASTSKHPLQPDLLSASYIEQTDVEGVSIETELDLRDAFIALMNGESYNISRFHAHHFASVIKQVLSRHNYDVVHMESLYTTPYIDTIRRYAPEALISLRSHNHEYQIWEQRWKASQNPLKRLALRHLTKTLERYERDILDQIDVMVSISETEGQGYRDWGYTGPLHVAGFGIDLSQQSKQPATATTNNRPKLRLFHLGAMDWGPNKEGVDWFVQDIWPDLLKQHDHIELHLAGKGMEANWYANVPRVFNHGEVESAAAFSRGKDLLVVPLLRGAGIRVKIVEALANSIPVATTTVGASGLALEDSNGVLVAEPQDMAAELSELIHQQERLDAMARSGLDIVQTKYDRRQIGKDLLAFYSQHVHV